MAASILDIDNALFAVKTASVKLDQATAAVKALNAATVNADVFLQATYNVSLAQIAYDQANAVFRDVIAQNQPDPTTVAQVLAETGIDISSSVHPVTPQICETVDQFQGLRFYDGTSYGYIRVFADKVQLLVDQPYEFAIDGTVQHTYRLTGKGKNLKLYIDGQLAIDASGKYTQPTSNKMIEFGDIAGRHQAVNSYWDTFRYSTKGAFAPNATSDYILDEMISFPNAAVSRLKTYNDKLYVSIDPVNPDRSSAIYRFEEGFPVEHRSALAITQSGITSIVIDPNRTANNFGTTGKYLGTSSGLQYVVGSKPEPFDFATSFTLLPDQGGWTLESNCDLPCAAVSAGVLTIDTTAESNSKFLKYSQAFPNDPWVKNADNRAGWTVEVRVKIFDDGSGGTINAAASALAGAAEIKSCGQNGQDQGVVPPDDGLNAPSVYLNDGTYQEFVQFFEKGIRLKYARIFATKNLTDQFYTVRIIGKDTSIAVYVKGDNEPQFSKVIFSSDGLQVRANPPATQEKPDLYADAAGVLHAVWQQAGPDNVAIYYSRLTNSALANGSGLMGAKKYDPNNTIIPSRPGFGLPPAGSGIDYTQMLQSVLVAPSASFISNGVKPGDFLQVFGKGAPAKRYTIRSVLDETLLSLDTSDDLSNVGPADWLVSSGVTAWAPPLLVSTESFDSVNPRMVGHTDGNLYVVYNNNQNGNNEIYLRKGILSTGGTSFQGVQRVTNSFRDASNPDIAEMLNGDLLIVWEDKSQDQTATHISFATISPIAIGLTTSLTSTDLTPLAVDAKNPRVACSRSIGLAGIVYQDDLVTAGLVEIYAIIGDTKTGATFGDPVKISSATGQSINPAIAASSNALFATWQDDSLGKPEIFLSRYDSGSQLWGSFRITSSIGVSRNPSIAIDSHDCPTVVFESDRSRTGFFELYLAKVAPFTGQSISYDPTTGMVTGGGFCVSSFYALDVKVRTYTTDSHNCSIAFDPSGKLALVWEGYMNGGRTTILGTSYDSFSLSSDDTVVGYFPLNENDGTTSIVNRVLDFNSDGTLQALTTAVPFNTTNVYSVPEPKSGVSLLNPADERAFELHRNGDGFKISSSAFIQTTGAIDMYVAPHWDSSSTLNHVFCGTGPLNTTVKNTFSFGVGPAMVGNAMNFRIVDSAGTIHETVVSGNPLDLWAQDESVQFRLVWDAAAIGTQSINCVSFPSSTVGFACAGLGAIFKTTDSGATWTKLATGTTYDLTSIDFIDANTGWACGEFGIVLYTTNGGATWTTVETGFETHDLKSIFFRTSSIGYVCGTSGLLLRSADGGQTWTQSTANAYTDLRSIAVLNDGAAAVVAVGQGAVIYRSLDDGLTFSIVSPIPIATHWNAVSRSHQGGAFTSYVVGDSGVMMKTTDAGATWVNITTGGWPNFFRPQLQAVSHGSTSATVWVAGQEGGLAYSPDAGVTWNFISTSLSQGSFRTIEANYGGTSAGATILAAGVGGMVLRTSDSGITNVYSTIRCGNLTIYMNGKELDQVRTADCPFSWDPTGQDFVFGDYQVGGTSTADAVFDQVIIYQQPPPNHSAINRQELRTYQTLSAALATGNSGKRIEWGNISPSIKTDSQWKTFNMFFCGAKEPLIVFAWNTTVGLVDDNVYDMALDNRGQLWIATENGISSFNTNVASQSIEAFLSGQPLPALKYSMFVNYTNIVDNLIEDTVNTICVDDNDNVWAGTDAGLMVLFRSATASDSVAVNANKLPGGVLSSNSPDANVKIGQDQSSAASNVDPTDPAVLNSAGPGALANGQVLNAPQSALLFNWLTMAQGLPSNKINIVRPVKGAVIVGTDSGMAVVTQGSQTQTNTTTGASAASSAFSVKIYTMADGLPSNNVQAIGQEKRTGEIWIGTDAGAVRFRPDNIVTYDTSNGLISSDIRSITIDSLDRKVFGTGFGISIVDGSDVTSFSPSSGIGTGVINEGAQDSTGAIWFATSDGLVEMDESCAGGVKFTLYDNQDGIIGEKNIIDFQRYKILGSKIPTGGCNKAVVNVAVNGTQQSSGFTVNPQVPWIVFDTPLTASDEVDVCLYQGWRLVKDFSTNGKAPVMATMDTASTTFLMFRKRMRAGIVTLGGNFAQGASNTSTSMYAVFAVPLPGTTGSAIGPVVTPLGTTVVNPEIGHTIYSDSPSDPIVTIPSELVGSQQILMPQTDSGNIDDNYLQFALLVDSTVYVAYDSRSGSLPSWLRDFDQVPSVLRVTDMETFTDGTNTEKLFLSTKGTKGCVYDILQDSTICDISEAIAIDVTGPSGCANITKINSPTSFTLKINASDGLTGVDSMQISPRSDFTIDGTTPSPFVPFQANYVFNLPPSASATTGTVAGLPDDVIPGGTTSLPAGIINNVFQDFNGALLIGTKNPGRVYSMDRATNVITLLFDTGEAEVNSMTVFGKLLIVGTGTNGRSFSWDGTALAQLPVSVGERVLSAWVYSNLVYLGYSPGGQIYTYDANGSMQLFKATNETQITAFATYGGRLFWTSGNETIEEGEALQTTTTLGHKHTVLVPAGTTRLSLLNAVTSMGPDGHVHQVVNGIVQPIESHTHGLNGVQSGKLFRFDPGTGQVIIVHSDTDSFMTAVAVTSEDTKSGILFAGTSPHGKILRYVPDEEVMIKSFQTPKLTVNKLRIIGGLMDAAVDDTVYKFTGKRWEYVASTTDIVHDIAALTSNSGDQNVLVLGDTQVGSTAAAPSLLNPTICAFVRFKDVAGNVTSIVDSSGKIIPCYNPCYNPGNQSITGGSGSSGASGAAGSGSSGISALIGKSRLLEVDLNAKVIFGLDGTEPFLSGNKVEKEVGIYYSEVFNGTNSFVQWVSIDWSADVPPGTSMTFAVRSAGTLAEVSKALWSPEFSDSTGNDITSQTGQFLQFRATLTAFEVAVASPVLHRVHIQLRTSQATHYFTTNFVLPDTLLNGILTYNGCVNPPVTDVVFGITGKDSTDFADYFVISPDKVFELPPEQQTENLRVGIKLISSPTEVPVVDEFALLFSLANDAKIKLNLAGTPASTNPTIVTDTSTRTVTTEKVQNHTHTITFDKTITDPTNINGKTSINAGHFHDIINGVLQQSAGHTHNFTI